MKQFIIASVLLLLLAGPALGQNVDGAYKLDGWHIAKLVIDGNKFDLEVRENEPETYCFGVKNGKIKKSGSKTLVYDGSNFVYEIKKKGNSIQLIPKGDPANVIKAWNGHKIVKEDWVHNRVIEGYWQEIPKFKWKRTR